MAENYTAEKHIDSQGRIMLPSEIRKFTGLQSGDKVAVSAEKTELGWRIVITKRGE